MVVLLPLMFSDQSNASSVSSKGLVTNPDSSSTASPKCNTIKQTEQAHYQEYDRSKKQKVWKKRKFVATYPDIQAGRGMSNFNSNWKLQDPLLKKLASIDKQTGDKIEFRNRGTKLNYRNTYDQDGQLRKSHKLNFPHFVMIRNFKKGGSKNC